MTLLRIFGSTFFELVGVLMLMPVLTVRLAARGEAPWLIGLFGASLYLAIFAVTPFTTRITQRWGLRAVYVASGCSPVLVVGVFLATTHVVAWLLAVAVMGLSGGLRWVTAEACVVGAASEERRGAVIGAFQAMVGACFVLGPLLLTVTGTEGPRPFLVSGALLCLGLLSLIGLEDLSSPDDGPAPGAFLRLLHERPLLLVAALIGGALGSGPSIFLPVEALGLGLDGRQAAALVAVLGVGGFVVQFFLGWLADRQPIPRLIAACLWTGLAGGVLLFAKAQGAVLLWPVAFLWGAAGAGIYTLSMIVVGHRYAGVGLVGATSALVFAFSAGAALSPAVTGFVMQASPRFGFALLMSAISLLGLLALRYGAQTLDASSGASRSSHSS